MSYCIALHSDIETLKKARKIFVERGFKDLGVPKGWNDSYFEKFSITGKDYLHIDGRLMFCNHNDFTSKTITCTPDNLNETIDLIIEKLKEK